MSWMVSVIVAGMMAFGANSELQTNRALVVVEPTCETTAKTTAAPAPQEETQTGTQEKFDQIYGFNPNGRVTLSNLNGSVTIEAWDKPEARVEWTKTIDCEKPMRIDVNIDATQSALNIETEYEKSTWTHSGPKDSKTWSNGYGNRCRRADVAYKLTLPRTARLDEVETVNGSITLSGLTDFVKASTVNGKVFASGLRGSINISSVNGTLEAAFDSFDNVREIKMGMVNGTINLQMPSDADATVKADTVNGSISNDFGLPVRRGEYVGRDLYGRIGDGKTSIRLNGVNGTINIRRKQDGRTPKPATNLLPPSDKKPGDDYDDNYSSAPRPPRPPRAARPAPPAPGAEIGAVIVEELNEQINDAVRDSVRESARAAREAAKAARVNSADIAKEVEKALAAADVERELREVERELGETEREMRRGAGAARFPYTERQAETVTVEGVPTVRVQARGGAVRIRGWEKQEVAYSFVKRDDNVTRKDVTLTKSGADVDLLVAADATDYRLEVFVPRKTNLRVTTQKTIRVEGVKGNLELDGANEAVDVRDSGGNLSVRLDNGNLRVIGFAGAGMVKTLNGNISLEGDFSSLDTDTAGGATILTLKEDAAVRLETTTKSVDFDGVAPRNPAGEETKNSMIWRIGAGDGANYKIRTRADGQVVIRGSSTVRVTRNCQISADSEIYS